MLTESKSAELKVESQANEEEPKKAKLSMEEDKEFATCLAEVIDDLDSFYLEDKTERMP